MIALTNSVCGGVLMLNIHHIVSIREDRSQTLIQTSTGVEYAVEESIEEIGKRREWSALAVIGG